jgi:extracellular elastinolytic metalloproteinase
MKFTTALLLASALAVPTGEEPHQLEYTKRNNRIIPFFFPANRFRTGKPKSFNLAPISDEAALEVAKKALLEELKLQPQELKITRTYRGKAGTLFVYGQHVVDGVPVDNHLCAATVRNGAIASLSSSFEGKQVRQRKDKKVSLARAVATAEKEYNLKRDPVPEKEVLIELPSGELALAYQFQLRGGTEWLQVSVSTQTGQVIQVVDYSSQASYEVIPLPAFSPDRARPNNGFAVLQNIENNVASPQGWTENGATIGNNVESLINREAARSNNGVFDTSFNPNAAPSAPENQRASVVNTFYLANYLHDVFYGFGFDERAGNFQRNNFGKGGIGNDEVIINNQAPGQNNASKIISL